MHFVVSMCLLLVLGVVLRPTSLVVPVRLLPLQLPIRWARENPPFVATGAGSQPAPLPMSFTPRDRTRCRARCRLVRLLLFRETATALSRLSFNNTSAAHGISPCDSRALRAQAKTTQQLSHDGNGWAEMSAFPDTLSLFVSFSFCSSLLSLSAYFSLSIVLLVAPSSLS